MSRALAQQPEPLDQEGKMELGRGVDLIPGPPTLWQQMGQHVKVSRRTQWHPDQKQVELGYYEAQDTNHGGSFAQLPRNLSTTLACQKGLDQRERVKRGYLQSNKARVSDILHRGGQKAK